MTNTCKDCQYFTDCRHIAEFECDTNRITETTTACRSFLPALPAESTDEEFVIKKPQFMRNKTVRMPEDLIKRVEAVAEANGVPFNQLVIQCIEYALERVKR